MTPEERDRIVFKLEAAWPNTPVEQAALLNARLQGWRYEQADAAVDKLVDECDRRPSLAKIREAYESLRSKFPQHALGKPACGLCDNGFVPARCNTESHDCDCGPKFTDAGNVCPYGHRTAAHCPNGCMPATTSERAETGRVEAHTARRRASQGVRTLDDDRVRAAMRDYSESSSRRDREEEVF